jgi:hypothetical protein
LGSLPAGGQVPKRLQGNHPTALRIQEGSAYWFFVALIFWSFYIKIKGQNKYLNIVIINDPTALGI